MEVCISDEWSSVCDNTWPLNPRYWDENDAIVVCRQLGYAPNGKSSPKCGILVSFKPFVNFFVTVFSYCRSRSIKREQ